MKKIKRDDEVIVTTGKDKGKRGKVLKVQDDGRLVVSGINMMKKHTKPNPMLGTPGGIVEVKEDGAKVRIFKSTNEAVDNQ